LKRDGFIVRIGTFGVVENVEDFDLVVGRIERRSISFFFCFFCGGFSGIAEVVELDIARVEGHASTRVEEAESFGEGVDGVGGKGAVDVFFGGGGGGFEIIGVFGEVDVVREEGLEGDGFGRFGFDGDDFDGGLQRILIDDFRRLFINGKSVISGRSSIRRGVIFDSGFFNGEVSFFI
jgi:hypothetical protein